jgi:multicomponent Na+:H+ antiporter subunit B
MTLAILGLWVLSAFIIVITEREAVRLIINFGVFSLITAGCFLVLAAPDVAMAQIVVGVFSTIIFLVALEKHYSITRPSAPKEKKSLKVLRYLLPACFVTILAVLFVAFMPNSAGDFALKELYTTRFHTEVGGENAVTAIYLGYRVYDTLFEALMLLLGVIAIIHLSCHRKITAEKEKPSGIHDSPIAGVTVRLICPLLLLCSIYIIVNGHITPGGGFVGGVMAASFFVCRYMIYHIYDIRIDKVLTIEKLAFIVLMGLAAAFVFAGIGNGFPLPKNLYLIVMNLFVGIKVGCGFLIVFYRFIALEKES